MVKRIVALEAEFAKEYFFKIENATAETLKLARDLYNDKEKNSIYSVNGKTAFIEITGPLSKKGPSFLDLYFGYGGTSYTEIIESIEKAENDFNIDTICLNMDTPGGEAGGNDEVWKALISSNKRTIAINNGMIASAGYWIASACDEIKAIESINETGSIGVVITAVDWSENLKQWGIKIYDITSENAPNKRPDISTKAGRDVLKERVNAIENIFIERVAQGRKTTIENVKANFGRGGLLIAENPEGPDAIKAGMIDGMAEDLQSNEKEFYNLNAIENKTAVNLIENQIKLNTFKNPMLGEKSEETMSLKDLLKQNPEALDEYNNEIAAAEKRGIEKNQAKINKIIPFLANENYKGIENLAKKVLSGESKIEAFEGAIAVFDMQAKKKESTLAIEETEKTGDTPPNTELNQLSEDGQNRSEADFQNSLNNAKDRFLGRAK